MEDAQLRAMAIDFSLKLHNGNNDVSLIIGSAQSIYYFLLGN